MTSLHPWINFNGNAEEAFTFYKSVFGGEFGKVVRFKDIAGPGFEVPEEELEKIMQITLPIGTGSMLVANDVPNAMGTVSERENRSKIHVLADSREDAMRIFGALSEGGEVEVPLDDSAPDVSFGMFRDRYGIEWVIEFDLGT